MNEQPPTDRPTPEPSKRWRRTRDGHWYRPRKSRFGGTEMSPTTWWTLLGSVLTSIAVIPMFRP